MWRQNIYIYSYTGGTKVKKNITVTLSCLRLWPIFTHALILRHPMCSACLSVRSFVRRPYQGGPSMGSWCPSVCLLFSGFVMNFYEFEISCSHCTRVQSQQLQWNETLLPACVSIEFKKATSVNPFGGHLLSVIWANGFYCCCCWHAGVLTDRYHHHHDRHHNVVCRCQRIYAKRHSKN